MKDKKIDKEIKELTGRLKHALAMKKQGFTSISSEDNAKYNSNTVYRFQCPRCKGKNTKRSGLTTQNEIKCRLYCLDCQDKRYISGDESITSFFVLSNQQVKDIIENDLTLNKQQKDFFLYKYLIKQKN